MAAISGRKTVAIFVILVVLSFGHSDEKVDKNIQESTADNLNDATDHGKKSMTKGGSDDQEKILKDEHLHAVEEQGRQLKSVEDGKTENLDVGVKYESATEMNKEDSVNDHSTETENTKETENKQNYFSFGNILRSIVDPVLDEFDKHAKKDKKNENINKNQKTSVMLNETNNSSLHLNLSTNDINVTQLETLNKTDKKTKFQCHGRNITNTTTLEKPQVKIVNNTVLLNMLNFDGNESSDCILVMFFAPWCHFCAQTAPNYNALARAFPHLDVVAVDAAQFSNLNARFGTVSVPNILLFHNSKAVVRFNQTDRGFDNLATFVKNITGLIPNTTLNVTDEDYIGPLPSVPTEDADYLLWVAWIFVIICSSFIFVQSTYGQQWINRVKILWQEHQHID